ncbi:MAG: DUF1559 domain-containing protein [Planctomycetes bacterium]|nr:DUF1559 domain-containing protein [Planctomycetota bacterium]
MTEALPEPSPTAETAPAHHHSGKRVVRVGLVLFVLSLAGMFLARVYIPRYVDAKRHANELACGEQLRKLGLAARQYASDHKVFPHVQAAAELDGGIETADTPLAFRSLFVGGYLDDSQLLICPSTPRRRGKADLKEWREWLQAKNQLPAPPFEAAKWLSYAWTRRQLSLNSPGAALLSGDRAAIPRRGKGGLRGNHTGGWSVLRVDGSVEFLGWDADPFPGSYLGATQDPARDGYLSVRPQLDRMVFDPYPTDGSGESYWGPRARRAPPAETPSPSAGGN